MSTFITVVHILTCVFLVLFVLVQSGKGAEISASFAGSSQTVFGSSGGANFFQKTTGVLAAIFFVTSVVLTILGNQSRKSLFEGQAPSPVTGAAVPGKTTVPAQPVAPPAAPEQGQATSANPPAGTAPAAPAAGAPAATPEKK